MKRETPARVVAALERRRSSAAQPQTTNRRPRTTERRNAIKEASK